MKQRVWWFRPGGQWLPRLLCQRRTRPETDPYAAYAGNAPAADPSGLAGGTGSADAAQTQRILLEQRAQQLAGAIQFCSQLQKNSQSLAALDVDQCLARMQTPDRQGGFFTGWLEDWQAVALAEHERTFSFIPDTSVQNPQEFTTALEAYAAENGLTLEMLQEGMTPRFLLDGLEYKAACYYGGRIPTAIIRCTANQPQLLDPPIPTRRARLLQAAHRMLLPGAVALGILLLLFPGASGADERPRMGGSCWAAWRWCWWPDDRPGLFSLL